MEAMSMGKGSGEGGTGRPVGHLRHVQMPGGSGRGDVDK